MFKTRVKGRERRVSAPYLDGRDTAEAAGSTTSEDGDVDARRRSVRFAPTISADAAAVPPAGRGTSGALVPLEGASEGDGASTVLSRGGGDEGKQAVPPIPEAMKQGMATLLRMHNPDELRFLTTQFQVPDSLSTEERLRTMHEVVLVMYRRVLRRVWEGILIEYWRAQGKKLKHFKFDLAAMVWKWWLRERTEKTTSKDWLPVFSRIEERPARPVTEGVASGQNAQWLRGIKPLQRDLKDAERHLRRVQNYEGLQTYFQAAGRLRNYETQGREQLLEELQAARKQLQMANDRNKDLYEQLCDAHDTTVKCFAGLEDWKKQTHQAEADLAQVRRDTEQLKEYLGKCLKGERRNNKTMRKELEAAAEDIVRHKEELIPAEEKKGRKLQKRHDRVKAEVDEQYAEIATWAHERERTRAKMAFLIAQSVHLDTYADTLLKGNAMAAAEFKAAEALFEERVGEMRNMALLLHAESETRYAMAANPKAFRNPPKSKRKGRSKTKKKRGKGKKGASKSKSKSKSKTRKKKKK